LLFHDFQDCENLIEKSIIRAILKVMNKVVLNQPLAEVSLFSIIFFILAIEAVGFLDLMNYPFAAPALHYTWDPNPRIKSYCSTPQILLLTLVNTATFS
jgi:hypothetical protein